MQPGDKRVVQVDTNVASYRYRLDPAFQQFRPFLEGKIGAISVVTYGECLYGARKANWSESRIKEYDAHLRTYLILPVDHEVVATYARLGAEQGRLGVGLSENDLWIAATAVRFDLPLLTNDSDLRRVRGLRCLPEEVAT